MIEPLAVVIPWSSTPTFDGGLGNSFEFTLAGDVSLPTCKSFSPGERYLFLIAQDAVGGHIFPWPNAVLGAQAINPAALHRTEQMFVCRADGRLYPLTAGVVNGS